MTTSATSSVESFFDLHHDSPGRKIVEKFYLQFEYLAPVFASKLYNTNYIGMSADDLEQEFRIKIWKSILSWADSKRKFQEEIKDCFEPAPLKSYVLTACTNLKNDFIKKINQNQNEEGAPLMVSFLEKEIEYGFNMDFDFQNTSNILEYRLFGVDLLDGLTAREKMIFILYIKGWKQSELKTKFNLNLEFLKKHFTILRNKFVDSKITSSADFILLISKNK